MRKRRHPDPTRVRPRLEALERRALLADFGIVGAIVQDPARDLTGPDASIGPDGFADLHATLEVQAQYWTDDRQAKHYVPVDSVLIEATTDAGASSWAYGTNPEALPNAEFVRVSQSRPGTSYPYFFDDSLTTAHLYFNPPKSGTRLTSLSITIIYAWPDNVAIGPDHPSKVNVIVADAGHLANGYSPARVAAKVPPPSVPLGGSAEFARQFSTSGTASNGQAHGAGDVQLFINSLPPGRGSFDDLSEVYLSNESFNNGNLWHWQRNPREVADLRTLPLLVGPAGDGRHVASLIFTPTRDEHRPTKDRPVPLLTLRFVFNDGSQGYTQLAVGSPIDVSLREDAQGKVNRAAPLIVVAPASDPSQVTFADPNRNNQRVTMPLQSLLDLASPGHLYDRIHLSAGNYLINTPPGVLPVVATQGGVTTSTHASALRIGRPVSLTGDADAVLTFTQDSSGSSPTARVVFNPPVLIESSHVTLDGFKIRFLHPVWIAGGGDAAVITGVEVGSIPEGRVDVNLTNLDIEGPPPAIRQGDRDGELRGRPSQGLVYLPNFSGTISGNRLRGGRVAVTRGPWTIADNTYVGVVPTRDTYTSLGLARPDTPAATTSRYVPAYTDMVFKLADHPHDVTLAGNRAYLLPAPDKDGTPSLGGTFRFLFIQDGGSDVEVVDNHVNDEADRQALSPGDRAGWGRIGRRLDDLDSSPARSPAPNGNPDNNPEIFLNETYKVSFEGKPTSVAGRVLSIPSADTTLRGDLIYPGFVVSILTGPDAGFWTRIAQPIVRGGQVDRDFHDFLTVDPLPAGDYAIAISQGLTNLTYARNVVDIRGTTSIAFVIGGNGFNVSATDNTIIGDSTYVVTGIGALEVNRAFRIGASAGPTYVRGDQPGGDGGNGHTYPHPLDYNWTHNPLFGLVVDGNRIVGSIGGISIAVTREGTKSSFGRTYVHGSIANNVFADYGTTPAPADPTRYPSLFIDPDAPLITVGNHVKWFRPDANGQHLLPAYDVATALVDANGRPISRGGSLGYVPHGDVDGGGPAYRFSFADPAEMILTIRGNSLTSRPEVDETKTVRIVSATVNGVVHGSTDPSSLSVTTRSLPATSSLTGTSLGQDGHDTANRSNRVGRDGLRDLHIRLDGLKSRGIARIDVVDITAASAETPAPARARYQYHEGWAASAGVPFDASLFTPTLGRAGGNPREMADPARYATSADLYLQSEATTPDGTPGRTFEVTLTYADGTRETVRIDGVRNGATLRMPPGDYDGDGRSDLAGYGSATGAWHLKPSSGPYLTFSYGAGGLDMPVPGDYDGDGTTNAAVFRPTTATWYAGNRSWQFGVVGLDTPVPASFGNPARTDLAVYRPSNATWYIRHQGTTLADEAIPFGWIHRDVPVPADYDGNGFDQVAVYRPLDVATRAEGGGTFFIRDPRTGVTRTVSFPDAQPGDIPVPADYDGIGRAEPALYRPSTGRFLVSNPAPGRFDIYPVGTSPSDVPIPGDYDGDGEVDPAVYRSSTRSWAYFSRGLGVVLSTVIDPAQWSSSAVPVAGPLASRRSSTTRAGIPAAATAGAGLVVPTSAGASFAGAAVRTVRVRRRPTRTARGAAPT